MQYIRGDKIFYHRELQDWLDNKTVVPITIEIHITNKCNMRCSFCFFDDRNKQLEMSKDDVIICIDKLYAAGVKGITFSGGGEPTVHKDFKEIATYAKSKGLDIALITNGLVDISDIINLFTWVRFSLDSPFPDTYKKIKGVDQLTEAKINIERCIANKGNTTIGVQMVIIVDNYDQISDMYNYCVKIGADYFQFRPVENSDYPNKVWGEINHARERFSKDKLAISVITTENKWVEITKSGKKQYTKCPGADFIGAIGVDGNYYICCHHVGKAGSYGNLLTEDIDTILSRRIKVQNAFNYSICPIACRGSNINLALNNFTKLQHINFL